MTTLQEITNQVFSGIDITPEEKGSFMDVYYIGTYKNIIELLTTIRGNTAEYHKAFNEFVLSTQKTFSSQEKTDFETIMQQGQKKLLLDLLTTIKHDLPMEMQSKLVENMKQIGLLPKEK